MLGDLGIRCAGQSAEVRIVRRRCGCPDGYIRSSQRHLRFNYQIARLFSFFLAIIAFATGSAWGQLQNPDIAPGIQPFQSYDGGDIDNVDLQTGNLIVKIPLISYPQRGDQLKLSFSIVWNGKNYITTRLNTPDDPTNIVIWQYNQGLSSAPRPTLSVVDDQNIVTGGFVYNPKSQTGSEYGPFYVTQWGTSDGSIHSGVQISGGQTGEVSFDGSGFFNGYDQSGTCSQYCYTIDSSGIAYYPQGPPGGSITGPLIVREDSNGNEITATYGSAPYYQMLSYTDTMGRTIPALPTPDMASTKGDFTGCTGSLPTYSSQDWNVPGANGSTLTYRFCYAQVAISLPVRCGVTTSPHTGEQLSLQSVVLPNKQTWTFAYISSSPGDPAGSNYGELSQITVPTGGTLSYTYHLLNGYTTEHCSMSVMSRTENANDGQGAHTTNYSGQYTVAATVTDPYNNQTVHAFSNLIDGTLNDSPLYEIRTQSYQGSSTSGTLLKTVQTSYNYIVMGSTPNGGAAIGNGAFNVFPYSRTTTLYAGSSSAVTTTEAMSYCCGYSFQTGTATEIPTLATYGLLSDDQVYDYASSGTGALLKENQTQYYFQTNSSYLTANMLSLPASRTTLGPSGTAYSTYTYDEKAWITAAGISTQHVAPLLGVRGNLSTTTVTENSKSTIQTHTNWYDTGVPYQLIDGRGNTAATYKYSSTYEGAFPTTVTNALTQNTKHTYDFSLGLKTSTVDANNQSTAFTYDNYGRLTDVQYPDIYQGNNGETHYTYNDTASPVNVVITKKAIPSPSITEEIDVDGFGRESVTQLQSDPAGTTYGRISYDAKDRKYQEWNPTRCNPVTSKSCSSETTWGITTYTYDALDRTLLKTQPDSTTQSWSYSGNTVTFTDESANQWQRTTDGLGRLTKLLEPNGTSTTPSMETDYTYDALDNLLSVTQCGAACSPLPANAVLRGFSYDSLSRLISATNPESGTATYSYDANGNLTTKTSPAVNASSGTQTLGYCYDSLNRMTAKFYSAPPTKCTTTGAVATYSYDSSPISGAANTVGRLTDEKAYIGGTLVSERSPYSYDAMGRILHEQQCPYSPACTAAYTFNYAYDLAGNLTNSNNGLTTAATSSLGLTFGFSYDGAGHMQSAGTTSQPSSWNGTASGTNYPTVLMQANQTSPVSYDPMGHLINAQLGLPTTSATAALNLARQYDNRGRITLEMDDSITFYQIPTTPVSGYAANGNLLSINDTITGNWTYGYDTLNRLTSAVSTSGPFSGDYGCWTYDAFGNRTLEALSSTTLTPCAANANDNVVLTPLTPIAGTNRATNFTYDDAGNVQNDGNNAYEYDAEGRICEAANTLTGSISIYQYLYDAEGRRVAKGSTTSTKCAAPTSANGFQLTNQYLLGQSGEQVTELGGTSGITPSHTNVWTSGGQLNTYDFAHGGLHFSLHDAVGTKRIQISGAGVPELSCASLPFGNSPGNGRTTACVPWGSSTAPDATEHHYTGKERDAESGLDYFGARYYASSMGRFMSPDPVGPWAADVSDPQSWNFYNYARNNPLINIDPTGLDCVHINNDTGAYEGFESGDCDNSTEEKANSGYYVDGTVSSISLNGQGQVTGYDANTSSGMFDSYAGSLNPSATAANLNPYTNALSAPGQSVTVNGNQMPGLDPSLDLLSNMMFSKAIQHNNPNPTKGAQPVRGKDGKITGWTLPGKGNKSGQRVPKTLQWGKENGLNPDDPRWTKMAVGVGAAAAGGLTVMQILEYAGAAAAVVP